ncbi:MAG: hypothetical protein C0490_19730, partial [Marivirga sp.]|nr:hypothetical protein [Marivirga sp.]
MKKQKVVFLFLALILPICIFIFLKLFGRNEFAVPPLYSDTYPDQGDCKDSIKLPYSIPDSIHSQLPLIQDSLVLIAFGEMSIGSNNQIKRIETEFGSDPLALFYATSSERYLFWKKCIFFLKDPLDLVLVDRSGVIRGQYES